jgi:predicted nucleic acid-binding protein
MIILDTNVVSSQMAGKRDFVVLEWLNKYDPGDLFLTSITIAEIFFGAYIVPDAARKEALIQSLSRLVGAYNNRILSFSLSNSETYGRTTASRRLAGRPIETKDAMIAAICLANNATLATRNVRDFEGLDLKLVNPFEA